MKVKIFAALLAVLMLLSLAACGDDKKDDVAAGVSMLNIFSPMFGISKVTAEDTLIGYYGNCPLYLSFVLGEGETVSADKTVILNENGETVSTVEERALVYAYAMSACVFNYVSGVTVDTKVLNSYEQYQTDYLIAAGYPDSSDAEAVDAFISDESAYQYLTSFIASGVEQLIAGDESLREKANNFIYDQLIADGTLNEDRTFTEAGMISYKSKVLVASEYAYLVENDYAGTIETLVENHYAFGAKSAVK